MRIPLNKHNKYGKNVKKRYVYIEDPTRKIQYVLKNGLPTICSA